MTNKMRVVLYMVLALFEIVSGRPLVRHIRSSQEFDRVIDKHSSSTGMPIIADFYSDGCGPCRMMAPVFKKLAKEHEGKAVFVKVDTNQVHQLSSRYSVRSIPTFISFHNGKKYNEFSGAGEGQLRQLTDAVVDKAEYENVKLVKEELVSYYKSVDESKSTDSVESVYQKCVDMMKDKNVQECVGAAAQKLVKNLKKKYKKTPKLDKRFTEEERTSSSSPEKSSDVDNNSSSSSTTTDNKTQPSSGNKANLHMATLEDLKAELDRRMFAAMEDTLEEEDDDNAEFEHSWIPTEYPERVVIIGGGPAGMSAAIYAARAGLEPVVVAPPMGGQLQGKGVDVENYPGMTSVTGPGIVASMRTQAASFGAKFEAESVVDIDVTSQPLRVITNSSIMETHSIILATGAESNWLDVPGEYEMRGGGVSTCATCDGHFFKDKKVVVVGGGDTAMEDALVLARTSQTVTLIHRRDAFRASKVLAQRVMDHPSITIRWNSTVQEIVGTPDTNDPSKLLVTGVILEHTVSGKLSNVPCNAVFVAIGHTPTTQFLEGRVEFHPNHDGYVQTYDSSTKTSIPGIFAAGDVADSVYRQAITSAGSGAQAALDAERYLSEYNLGNEEAEFEAELLRELMEDMPSSRGSNVYEDGNSVKG